MVLSMESIMDSSREGEFLSTRPMFTSTLSMAEWFSI